MNILVMSKKLRAKMLPGMYSKYVNPKMQGVTVFYCKSNNSVFCTVATFNMLN